MAKSNARDRIKKTSVDDLFSTEESRADSQREKVLEISLSEISDFPNHPFKVKASELAGRETMPCIVRDLGDDEAIIIKVDSNLQRENILPSEKAFAYR